MVLKAEVYSMKGNLFSRWDRAMCSAMAIASSVDLLGRYANCSGSRVSGKVEMEEIWSLTSLSKHFMMTEVKAMGR